MTVTATVRVMSPEEIAAKAGGETPFLHPPQRSTVFAERAMRLRQLARGHAMEDFLNFMADLAQAQQERLARVSRACRCPTPRRSTAPRAWACRRCRPPNGRAMPAWQARAARAGGRSARHARRPAPSPRCSRVAERRRRLAGAPGRLPAHRRDAGARPGRRADRRRRAAGLLGAHGERRARSGRPAAASPSAASTTRPPAPAAAAGRWPASRARSGDLLGQRYLHCSLCSMQWHMLRIKCSHCLSTKQHRLPVARRGRRRGRRRQPRRDGRGAGRDLRRLRPLPEDHAHRARPLRRAGGRRPGQRSRSTCWCPTPACSATA